MNEALLTERYSAIKKRLAEPVPTELISTRYQKTRDGAEIGIQYINITDYKDLLDQRCGENVWEALISDWKQVGNSLTCVVKLVIHCDDGAFAQDGTGIEPLEIAGYGDPFSNAYAQAFRRACEGHGLSRELWRGEHGQQRPQQPSNGNQPRPAQPQPVQRHEAPIASNLGELVSQKQLGMIRALARELRMDADNECLSLNNCSTEELSKRAASDFIKHLQDLQKGGAVMPLRRAS